MADKTVSLELKIDASGAAQSVGDLKKSIVDLKNQALKVGEDTPLGRQFIADAGKAKDKLNDLNKQVDAFQDAGAKFGAVTKLVGSLAGGFQAAQGAAALFGSSGEDLQKVLVKVQAATALAQGAQALAGITDEIGAVKKIALATASNVASAATATYSTVVGVATGKIKIATLAQEAWNLAMSLNPIGVIITLIGLMVVGITQLIIAETDEEKALKALNKQLQLNNLERDRDIESIKIQQANYQKASQNELKLMQLNGATQEEINAKKFSQFAKLEDLNNKLILQERKKIENNEDLIAGLPAIQSRTAEQVETYNNLSKEIDKSNLAITALIFSNEDLAISTQTLSNEVNGVVESEKEYNAVKQQQLDHLKALSDAGQVGSIGYYNFLLGESNDKLNKLVPGSAAYNNELKKKIDLQTKLNAAEAIADPAKNAKLAEELKKKQASDFAALTEKEYADSIKSTAEYYDHLIALAKLNNEDTTALENKKAEELIGIGDEYGQKTLAQQDALLLEKKKQKEDAAKKEVDDAVKLAQENLSGGVGGSELANQIALENALYEQAKIANINLEELEKKHIEKIAALKNASALKTVQAGIKMAQDSLSAIQNLTDVAYTAKLSNVKKGSKEEEAILRKQFETNKKMQIASAIINGALAVTNIIATVPKADFGISTAIMLVSAASATAASVAKIAATKFDSSGGALSPPSFSAGILPDVGGAPNLEGNQPNTNIPGANGNSNSTKVYVTETDIKRVTNRVNVIESRATFR